MNINQPKLFDLRQRFAHSAATSAESGGKIPFGRQAFTRPKLAAKDFIAQNARDFMAAGHRGRKCYGGY